MNSIAASIRKTFHPEFTALRARSSVLEGFFVVCGYLCHIFAAVALFKLVKPVSPTAAYVLYPALLVIIGSRMRALGNIVHECTHLIFVSGRLGNEFFGNLLSILDFSSYAKYRHDHISHHRYLGDPGKDLDFAGRAFLTDSYFQNKGWETCLRLPGLLNAVYSNFRPVVFSSFDSATVTAFRILFLCSLMWVSFAYPQIGIDLLAYYVIPYCTSYQLIRFFSDVADHAGLMQSDDEFFRARNHVLKPKWLNWVLFPRHDAYHLVHHLFPQLPSRYFRLCHLKLLSDDHYRRFAD